MSQGPWSLDFSATHARRDLRRLDAQVRARVIAALERLAENPHGGGLRKLSSRPESRLRIGDWRALVALDEQTRTIHVVRVLPRGRVYDR